MTNRQKLIERLQNVSTELHHELNYLLDFDRDYDYDLCDAFTDASDTLENNKNSKLEYEFRSIYIDIEYAIPVNIENIIVSHGKRYWFKRNGVHYQCENAWSIWLEK